MSVWTYLFFYGTVLKRCEAPTFLIFVYVNITVLSLKVCNLFFFFILVIFIFLLLLSGKSFPHIKVKG